MEWPKVGAFARRHKQAVEELAISAGMAIGWRLVGAAMFGAGVAGAAVLASSSSVTYHPGFSLSTKGAAFLTRHEGVRYSPYNDPFNCTVGVGHLIHYGGCSVSDYGRWRITPAQATALLMHDSAGAASCIRTRITHPISQAQFDALVDLVFNAGCGSLDYRGVRSTINAGALSAVPGRIATTAVTASGVYLRGLATRRLDEGALFSRAYYGAGIGYYAPPRPLTAAQRTALAKAARVKALRSRRGYFSWLAWYLAEGSWRGYGHANPKVRPHVPARIPASWWRRERVFIKARGL